MTKILFGILLSVAFLHEGKAQWIEQYSGDTVIFKSISAIDNNVAWLCGDVQRVYRTTNSGTNWIRRSSTAFPYPLSMSNIFALNQNVALVTGTFNGDRTFVFRTSNGGGSWTQVFTQQNGFINSICMTDSTNGFMEGDPVFGRWSLWRTTNAGISWDSSGLYLPAAGKEFGFVNCLYANSQSGQSSIWFGTDNFRVYHSSNNGLNWNAQMIQTCQYIYAIWFNLPQQGMLGGSGIFVTSNGGENWILSSSMNSTGGITGEGNNWWSVQSYSPGIFYSSNNGINWATQFYDTNIQFVHIAIPRIHANQYSVWAVGNPGKIYKLITSVGIPQNFNETPNKFYLHQNYPNPFNPVTRIDFEIPFSQVVKIKIFDNLGKELITLINEKLSEGEHSVLFDAKNLSSGIYYYKIETKEFAKVKKMILIK